ncbi:MAG: 50S ribosomal protein L6 [bacterium]
MSRTGKREIPLPQGVTVSIKGNSVEVKGKLGALRREFHPRVSVEQDGNVLRVKRQSDSRGDKALHGLSRTLLANMVTGVSEGFAKSLELNGVGYRMEKKGNRVLFQVGFSHSVDLPVPDDLTMDVEKNVITVKGIDKERVGAVSASIRAIRPPDPYKGKGIRYRGEMVKLKPGKSGA